MKLDFITVRVNPKWMDGRVLLSLTVDIMGQQIRSEHLLTEDDFKSRFDMCMDAAADALKEEVRKQIALYAEGK